MKLIDTHGFPFWEWVIASPSQKTRMRIIQRQIRDMESGKWLARIREDVAFKMELRERRG